MNATSKRGPATQGSSAGPHLIIGWGLFNSTTERKTYRVAACHQARHSQAVAFRPSISVPLEESFAQSPGGGLNVLLMAP
jgi:hypothetical protein